MIEDTLKRIQDRPPLFSVQTAVDRKMINNARNWETIFLHNENFYFDQKRKKFIAFLKTEKDVIRKAGKFHDYIFKRVFSKKYLASLKEVTIELTPPEEENGIGKWKAELVWVNEFEEVFTHSFSDYMPLEQLISCLLVTVVRK